MRNRTKLGLAAVVSVTGFIVACGDDPASPGPVLPTGGTGVVGGGGNPTTTGGGGAAAGSIATGGAAAGTFSTAGTGGDVGGTGGSGGAAGGSGGTAGAAAGMGGFGGFPPAIKPTVFLIDNVRLQLKVPSCGTGGTGGTGGGGAGGTAGGSAGGTGGNVMCGGTGGGGAGGTAGGGAGGTAGGGAAGGGAGGTGGAGAGGGGTGGTGGDTGGGGTGGAGAGGGGTGGTGGAPVVPDPSPTPFNFTFDADVMPLAKNPNGFSPGPGQSMGPRIVDDTFLTFEPTLGHPGGAAKISVPFSEKSQQADFGTAFVPASVNGTGYEILADVNMVETGDVAECATVWVYVYGGSGYANDKSGEPTLGTTSHLKKGEWTTVRLDLDGPYGAHSVNNGAYKPEHVGIWGLQLNTWGCP